MLSRKLKNTQNLSSILKVASVAAPLYVFAWVRHELLWVYAIWTLETQQWSLFGTVGLC